MSHHIKNSQILCPIDVYQILSPLEVHQGAMHLPRGGSGLASTPGREDLEAYKLMTRNVPGVYESVFSLVALLISVSVFPGPHAGVTGTSPES